MSNGDWTVICPHCHAGVGFPCTIPGTMTPLKLSAAHPSRMELVGKRPDYSVVGKYREMFPSSADVAAGFVKATEGDRPPKEDPYVPQVADEPPVGQDVRPDVADEASL
jgi:hypothetical protein